MQGSEQLIRDRLFEVLCIPAHPTELGQGHESCVSRDKTSTDRPTAAGLADDVALDDLLHVAHELDEDFRPGHRNVHGRREHLPPMPRPDRPYDHRVARLLLRRLNGLLLIGGIGGVVGINLGALAHLIDEVRDVR